MKSKINFNKLKQKYEEGIEKMNTKKQSKPKKVKTPKVKKPKAKRKGWRKLGYFVVLFIIFCAIIGVISLAGFGYYIVQSAPEFSPDNLYEKEATLIYDAKKNLIATLGVEKREKVSYQELPEVLVDAIIATEDSRFFQHNGFDLPRFAKATIGQLLGRDAGGASTLTMQVSKNSFTSTESSGIEGIIRKFTDIYMSIFKIEQNFTKEEIIEFYVNAPCLGGSIYGVEQASKSYFGKSVGDLSLVEAATIAGLFQSPNGYNPYVYPEAANERKNTVLYLMKRHGYISDAEYNAAKEIFVGDILASNSNTSNNPYQGFIDTVVQEVEDKTKNNPYDVPMVIYSTMVAEKQSIINDFYSGKSGYKFKDEKVEVGIGVIDNKTGAIIAVGAGRNKKTEMSLNYATQINRHPGSTAKPIVVYGPGFEYQKWSTYGPFLDEPHKYGSGTIKNNSGGYSGFQSLRKCLTSSINTCAIEGYYKLDNADILTFMRSIGIEPQLEGDNWVSPSHAIGAFNGVSPVQLAAAYASFGSGGYYTAPYSFTKVEYRETGEVYENNIKRERVMSAQTAYLITNILISATNYQVKVPGTQIATKTGTSSYEEKYLKSIGLNLSVIQDSWTSSYSPDYAIAIWYGYDEINKDYVKKGWYNKQSHASSERFKIQAKIANALYEKNSKFKSPGGIVSKTIELETIPAQLPSANTPSALTGSFLFISGTEPTEVSTRFETLQSVKDAYYTTAGNYANIYWTSPGTPSAIDSTYLENYFNSGYGAFANKYLNKRIAYNNKSIGEFGYEVYGTNGATSTYLGFTANTYYSNVDMSKYDGAIIKSAYSKFKSNRSGNYTIKFGNTGTIIDTITTTMTDLNITILKNSTFTELNTAQVEIKNSSNQSIKNQVNGLSVVVTSSATSGGTAVAPVDIPNNNGNYEVVYLVSFSHNGQNYSETFTQHITVN